MSSSSSSPSRDELPDEARAIVEEEETILERLQARLTSEAAAGSQVLGNLDAQLIELRDAVAEAKEEDVASLVEQMHQVASLRSKRGKGRSVPVDPKNPYFGHMRLQDAATGRRRDVLIGRHTLLDDGSGLSVVDWRNAPVSRLYYRYEEGDEYEEAFDDRVLEGRLEVRRSVAIHGGALRRIACPQGTFARTRDGMWRVAVGHAKPTLAGGAGAALRYDRNRLGIGGEDDAPRADKHLQEITALIDARQFQLITQPESGIVLIQGGAGSGKTTVALHRVAYLAYQDPRRFAPSKMMVVVFNDALVEYIKHVLPSLGVEGVRVTTYRRWTRDLLRRLRLPLPQGRSTQTPEVVARFKKHPVMIEMIERLVAEKDEAVAEDLEERVGEAAAKAWRSDPRAPMGRIRSLRAGAHRLAETAAARTALETVLSEAERAFADVAEDYYELNTNPDRIRGAIEQAAPDAFEPKDVEKIVAWCMRKAEAIDAGDERDLSDAALPDEEDDVVILRLLQRQSGGIFAGGRRIEYEHLVIDEAQDLCALEVRVLLDCVSKGQSVTIAGDRAQKMIFDNDFRDWPELLQAAGLPHTAIEPLEITYRSTRPIMAFSRHVLGPLADGDGAIVAREGAPVAFFEFGDTGECVAHLGEALRDLMAREPTASVALIARYPQQADLYFQALRVAEVPKLRRVAHQDFSFTPGIDVTDVRQVKGLEFDYVVLLDVSAANYPEQDQARHLLHIAATRAAHQLWVTSAGPASNLLPAELVETGLYPAAGDMSGTPAPGDAETGPGEAVPAAGQPSAPATADRRRSGT